MDPGRARQLWRSYESLHAVTYFAPEARDANRRLGLRGFWMGYFAARAAPLGPVGPAVVEACFAGFAPAMVRRSLPDAWSFARPEEVLAARRQAAAAALRRSAPEVATLAADLAAALELAVVGAGATGRPLFAANRDLAVPDDPVEALWQHTTTLREHRGDGHVSALVAADLDGCEPLVLFAAGEGVPSELLRDNRGWSSEDWQQAVERLRARGLLGADDAITAEGRALRARVEDVTDVLSARALARIPDPERTRVGARLDQLARSVAAAGDIPYPNPMGLPAPPPPDAP